MDAHPHPTPTPTHVQELGREALLLLPAFKPQELSNLLWALATMGHYPGDDPVGRISGEDCLCLTSCNGDDQRGGIIIIIQKNGVYL